jgi:NAD-dependent SIR2 family protein deacetylase
MFFCYTSNIDGLFRSSGYNEEELEEIHGSVDFWQCANPEQCVNPRYTWWWLPKEFRFEIDPQTLTAPNVENTSLPLLSSNDSLPKYLSGFYQRVEEKVSYPGFQRNHPKCINCGGNARPNVVMFDDTKYIDGPQTSHYQEWESVVRELVDTHNAKLVILEIGCGMRVPSVRVHTEQLLMECPTARLVRVNPEYLDCNFTANYDVSSRYLAIKDSGLSTLRNINEYLCNKP